MITLVDIGNSRVKWGWLDGQGLQVGQPLPTMGDLVQALSLAWAELPPPRRVLVSNVAGAELGLSLDRWLHSRFGIAADSVSSRSQGYGVINGYREPQRLGCDRWVALVALRHGWRGAACVVDVGTAATFDLLDGAGRHRGGAIIPGLRLMARALVSNTAAITGVETADASWLGDNTGAAIHSGALNAVAGMAERLRRQASKLLGEDVAGILTGGDAPPVAASLGGDWQTAANLVLQGLAIMAQGEA